MALAAMIAATVGGSATAQDSPDSDPRDRLEQIEARLAERYDRLEILASRLAELSGSTQPRRAELLRQLVARGREQNVPGQFDDIVAALEEESFSTAVDGQTRLQGDLAKLLELLLQEDRDRQLESQRKRVLRYVQELNRLIRLQRGIKARTEGGDETGELAEDQERAGENVEKLKQEIADDAEAAAPTASAGGSGEGAQGTPPGDQEGERESPEGEPQDGEPQEGDSQEGESQDGSSEGDSPPGEQPPKGAQGSQGESSEGQRSEGSEGESEAGEQPQESTPMQRAAERLRRAQERMQNATERLKEAQRGGAAEDQERAVEELETAKAELEKILRQLREEEVERMLTLLEARFRKMLEEQVAIYEETKRLEAAANAPEHELEIAAGRLSRREQQIAREADRALVLLREDGTSLAFPEAVEQARDDMQSIAERLSDVKFDMLTQGLEEDVIAALEETLAALRQALQEHRDQKSQPQQPGGGSPGEEPLIHSLAELRMIRALQQRINRRTSQYGALIEGEQALEEDLLAMLEELAMRQAKIVEATRDLETGSNR